MKQFEIKGDFSNVVKLSASWEDNPLAERSRSRQNCFDFTLRMA
ncbi:MAG: hypothetical protein QX196_00450 [Methylococcaceae bacterium]